MRTEILKHVGFNTNTKKRANISVDLVYVTPEVAKNFLRYNTINRKESVKNVSFLTSQMLKGEFLENGESIVFDINNNLTDGAHRLKAIIKSNKSYHIPIVRGVNSNSMATYDTGKNRTSADVLSLNGFNNAAILSTVIKIINKYDVKSSKAASASSYNRAETLTNQAVLEYCKDNYDWLIALIKANKSIYKKSESNVLSLSNSCYIVFLIGGKNPSKEVYEFMKNIYGLSRTQDTATSYVFNKLHNSKINKEPLNFYWLLGMTIKAWNYHIDGNPAVRYFSFKTTQELPNINKLNK